MSQNHYNTQIDKVKALDFAIRDALNEPSCGYTIHGKEAPYYNYMSNEAWEEFKNDMSYEHKQQYKDGHGGELNEKDGTPPKMASFGSSSRLIYLLSKDVAGFSFEEKLSTKVGGPANLDGYLKTEEQDIYVEAKCREIYGSYANQKISKVYKDVYDFIREKNGLFGYRDTEIEGDNGHFKCTFTWDDKEIIHFDLKQLICHFLGICANILEKEANPDVKFIYLIFNPNEDTDFSDVHIKDFEKEIKNDYSKTLEEISWLKDFKWLFDIIMEYQSRRNFKSIQTWSLDFALMDQNDYRDYLKQFLFTR
jgi:hypothetical protein